MNQIELTSKLGLAIIAIIAISVAVGTQAYYIQVADAQAKLPNNSVSSETIVNGQVKTDDLASDAVTSTKIKNGEVKTEDLASGAVKPTNPQFVTGPLVILHPGERGGFEAECPTGTFLTGGGFQIGADVAVLASRPLGQDDNIWTVFGENVGTTDGDITAYALCMGPSP
jgi:hypothetical protein